MHLNIYFFILIKVVSIGSTFSFLKEVAFLNTAVLNCHCFSVMKLFLCYIAVTFPTLSMGAMSHAEKFNDKGIIIYKLN